MNRSEEPEGSPYGMGEREEVKEPISDERAREAYTMAIAWRGMPDSGQTENIVRVRNALREEWDAWIDAHDKALAARAWEEGVEFMEAYIYGERTNARAYNPYTDGEVE